MDKTYAEQQGQQRVSQLVQEGMPTDSVEAAQVWRNERGLKRAPVNSSVPRKGTGEADIVIPPSKTGDSLLDALNNARVVSEQAFILVTNAMYDGSSRIGPDLHVHNKAVEALLATEKSVREEMERRKLLVPINEVTEMFRRGMDAILRRLKKLPQEKGPQCNPENPHLALTILEKEINAIIADGQRAIDSAKP